MTHNYERKNKILQNGGVFFFNLVLPKNSVIFVMAKLNFSSNQNIAGLLYGQRYTKDAKKKQVDCKLSI